MLNFEYRSFSSIKTILLDAISNPAKLRVLLSIFAIIISIYNFIFVSNYGSISPWGDINLTFNLIPNTIFFYIFVIIGNSLIILTYFLKTDPKKDLILITNQTEKQLFLLGVLVFFIGVIGFFDFLLLEPFVLVYLLTVLFIYKNLSSFIQPEYNNFNFFGTFTPWNPKTKILLNNYANSGYIDIGFYILILIFVTLILLFFIDRNPLVSDKRINSIRLKSIKIYVENKNHVSISLLFFTIYIIFIFFFLIINERFLIGALLLLAMFPVKYNKGMRLLKWNRFLKLRFNPSILDLYFFIIFIVLNLFFLLKNALLLHFILLYSLTISISVSIKATLFLKKKFKEKSVFDQDLTVRLNITFSSVLKDIFVLIILTYIGIWIISTNDPLEDLLFRMIATIILAKYGYNIIKNLNDKLIKYIFHRLVFLIFTFMGISLVIYGLLSIFIEFLLINLFNNWLNWIFHFILGDFGEYTSRGNVSITYSILELLLPTFEISFIPLVVGIYISVRLAKYAVKRYGNFADNAVLIFIAFGMSIPSFVFVLYLILTLSGQLKIFPSFGRKIYADLDSVNLAYVKLFLKDVNINIFNIETLTMNLNNFFSFDKIDWIFHFSIPLIALSFFGSAYITKLLRSSLFTVLNEPYIMSAKAYGFTEKTIINKHALYNSLIPVLTYVGLMIVTLLTTIPIIEYITSWQGIGYYGIDALLDLNADFTSLNTYPVILAVSMIISLMTLFTNLIIDITYAIIDPRVTY